jgi:hypothetical protein
MGRREIPSLAADSRKRPRGLASHSLFQNYLPMFDKNWIICCGILLGRLMKLHEH